MDLMHLVDSFGTYFAEIGLSKTFGRLFGIFMTEKNPISMGGVVEKLQISKSTASTELRRLMTMGFIEKVPVAHERADFFKLKENIWVLNLMQKLDDIKRLRTIIEDIPEQELAHLTRLEEMTRYCLFMEEELKELIMKYQKQS